MAEPRSDKMNKFLEFSKDDAPPPARPQHKLTTSRPNGSQRHLSAVSVMWLTACLWVLRPREPIPLPQRLGLVGAAERVGGDAGGVKATGLRFSPIGQLTLFRRRPPLRRMPTTSLTATTIP
jgi:hypothetical protein